jgi:hypothetical protein
LIIRHCRMVKIGDIVDVILSSCPGSSTVSARNRGGDMIFNVKPCSRECNPSNELGEILIGIDESVRQLNEVSELHRKTAQIRKVQRKVEWMLDRVQKREWEGIHPQLEELVYYLELCCFSWLNMTGESFQTYLEEVNQRYRKLLWRLMTFHRQQKRNDD